MIDVIKPNIFWSPPENSALYIYIRGHPWYTYEQIEEMLVGILAKAHYCYPAIVYVYEESSLVDLPFKIMIWNRKPNVHLLPDFLRINANYSILVYSSDRHKLDNFLYEVLLVQRPELGVGVLTDPLDISHMHVLVELPEHLEYKDIWEKIYRNRR